MVKQKALLMVEMKDAKMRSRALKTAAGCPGVDSVEVAGENRVVVIGDGIDWISMTVELRKRVSLVEIASVTPVYNKKEEKKEGAPKPKEEAPQRELIQAYAYRQPTTLSRQPDWPIFRKGPFREESGQDQPQQFEYTADIPQPISQADELTICGREDDMKKFIGLLFSDDCRDQDVSLIQVVGDGGVGKTTLVQLVYNNARVTEIFDARAWIIVSERIDAKGLGKAIAESLTGIPCGPTEVSELKETVREELMGKRFLLVLDDVCNMEQSFWSSLLVDLNVGAKGSVVIVTARNRIVASARGGIMRPYYLHRLSEENCWLVFQQRAFGQRDPNAHLEMREMGKRISTKCNGNPLAAKALGDLLFSAPNLVFWYAVLTSELWLQRTPEPFAALRLSFDLLPIHLKRCLQYCSLFPKGYVFKKDYLIRLWMSQGFIEPKGVRHEDIGMEYFDELFRRSFFQSSPIYNFMESKYVMNNLFHDLVQILSLNMCFRIEGSYLLSIPENLHHISVVPYELETMMHFEPPKEPRELHTFLLINRSVLKWAGNQFHFQNLDVLTDMFQKFRGLRTLDLSFTDIKVLPDSVADLKHLCYLGLNYTNIRRLPESICSLYRLQSLELRGCDFLCELPKDIKKLTNLRHLDIRKESGFVSMPKGIGKLMNLQTLSTFNVGGDRWYCGIEELKGLVNLRKGLCIGGLENVINWEDAKEANLKNKGFLQTLILQWFNNGDDLGGDESARTCFEVLQNLQPHDSLEVLIIRNYLGGHFPSWMGNPSFFKLISITLDNCYECDTLPPLGQLRCLRHLSIRKMDSVQSIGREFCGSDTMGTSGFPSLETLKLWEMSDLEEWRGVEDEDFPHLRSLSISRCPRLRRFPHFTSLEELSFHSCVQLPGLPTLPSLKSLTIAGFQSLISLSLPHDLPGLKMLELNHCNQLSSVGGLSQLASVEKLKLIKCPKLHFSPNEQLPSMLQVIDIPCGCPQLSDWCHDNFKQVVDANQASRKLIRK